MVDDNKKPKLGLVSEEPRKSETEFVRRERIHSTILRLYAIPKTTTNS